MPLSQVVVDGLIEGAGAIGLVLKTVVAYEKANWQDIDWEGLRKLNIGARELESSYRESIRWASQLGAVVGNA
jgi:c-di-GMP-related signal transduction protein